MDKALPLDFTFTANNIRTIKVNEKVAKINGVGGMAMKAGKGKGYLKRK